MCGAALKWDEDAWSDYLYWQTQDKKTLKKVNSFLTDITRDPFDGIRKPEPLKYRQGYWSRRIDETNRIVYKVENDTVVIASVRGHYDD
ncbi:MAG: Txe/YoeB family addiction module toxin [Bacteroides sp.]|nr:Txe/YoeB family addiction module toxin [Eubacterium sp.]MCM1419670.1 Txe/YoeB family addiction module toxin [Roseburia sp.]MCM1463639.1 Txe/YoeB family addiction module toxin [Bacteroides sp.]